MSPFRHLQFLSGFQIFKKICTSLQQTKYTSYLEENGRNGDMDLMGREAVTVYTVYHNIYF
jgi:hypothetical protein